jgi:hydroxymethylbilane synthase
MAPILIATRGSALALAQANSVLAQCRDTFPELEFALNIIKTTGDKLQTASMAQEGQSLPKGLFTKELEVALLEHKADLAVHSLKDLPTELPTGLRLGCVGRRADVRDVLLYRDKGSASGRGFAQGLTLDGLPAGAVVATSSTRRRAQLLAANPALTAPEIRGNVLTRIQKLADKPEMDATILALAGITRLNYTITSEGFLTGDNVPVGIRATVLSTEVMLPCVGQGAVGIEIREADDRLIGICARLNDFETFYCVTAERAFLAGMGGGCQSPVAAHARMEGPQIRMTALSFANGPVRRAESTRAAEQAVELGRSLASTLKS